MVFSNTNLNLGWGHFYLLELITKVVSQLSKPQHIIPDVWTNNLRITSPLSLTPFFGLVSISNTNFTTYKGPKVILVSFWCSLSLSHYSCTLYISHTPPFSLPFISHLHEIRPAGDENINNTTFLINDSIYLKILQVCFYQQVSPSTSSLAFKQVTFSRSFQFQNYLYTRWPLYSFIFFIVLLSFILLWHLPYF